MLTPNGNSATTANRLILLSIWVKYLQEEMTNGNNCREIISAYMGKPTYPISQCAVKTAISYWENIQRKSKKAVQLVAVDGASASTRSRIADIAGTIDYGDPRGELLYRTQMASALTKNYQYKVTISAENILFTVGGSAALHNIFKIINRKTPNSFIVTPFPHYILYSGYEKQNNLYPIFVMQESGYQLTATVLAKSLADATLKAKKNKTVVSAFLLCDPNNPLGTVLEESEVLKIAEVLRQYPDLLIILDEVYSEMVFDGAKFTSLLQAAPDLKNRIILMRSATKALSAAGERMAVMAIFNSVLMDQLVQENIAICVHAPISGQAIFSDTMKNLNDEDFKKINDYYLPQVRYIENRLRDMGAAMPDPNYKVKSTFYVLADLSDLLGMDIPKVTYRALNKTGKITTDEDIIYSLLFVDSISIMPLSYFGHSPSDGYVRITCSVGDERLCELANRIESRLMSARLIKNQNLEIEIANKLKKLEKTDINLANEISKQLNLSDNPVTALDLKIRNIFLQNILLKIN